MRVLELTNYDGTKEIIFNPISWAPYDEGIRVQLQRDVQTKTPSVLKAVSKHTKTVLFKNVYDYISFKC